MNGLEKEKVEIQINGELYDLYVDDMFVDNVSHYNAIKLLDMAGLSMSCMHNVEGAAIFYLPEGTTKEIIGK